MVKLQKPEPTTFVGFVDKYGDLYAASPKAEIQRLTALARQKGFSCSTDQIEKAFHARKMERKEKLKEAGAAGDPQGPQQLMLPHAKFNSELLLLSHDVERVKLDLVRAKEELSSIATRIQRLAISAT